jgi:hypothetical protein
MEGCGGDEPDASGFYEIALCFLMSKSNGDHRFVLGYTVLAFAISATTLAANPPGADRRLAGEADTVRARPLLQALSGDASGIDEALQWLSAPVRYRSQYNFELTVDIRVLVFWTSRDDVGGGYIKIGEAAGDPDLEVIRLLFGSDPHKAHGINRWGAGTEVTRRSPGGTAESSAFFGFMKSSQGESASAMEQEVAKEKQQGRHRFEAVVSRADPGRAVSTTVPFYSDHDFDFHELEPAEQTVLAQIRDGPARQFHALNGTASGCGHGNGFLSAVRDLAGEALDQRQPPVSLCYIYNSKQYTLSLDAVRPVPDKIVQFAVADGKQKIEHHYHDLDEARFHVLNRATGKKTYFALLLGTAGELRGAPVQINYQPNWWFRITLNLQPPAGETPNQP